MLTLINQYPVYLLQASQLLTFTFLAVRSRCSFRFSAVDSAHDIRRSGVLVSEMFRRRLICPKYCGFIISRVHTLRIGAQPPSYTTPTPVYMIFKRNILQSNSGSCTKPCNPCLPICKAFHHNTMFFICNN